MVLRYIFGSGARHRCQIVWCAWRLDQRPLEDVGARNSENLRVSFAERQRLSVSRWPRVPVRFVVCCGTDTVFGDQCVAGRCRVGCGLGFLIFYHFFFFVHPVRCRILFSIVAIIPSFTSFLTIETLCPSPDETAVRFPGAEKQIQTIDRIIRPCSSSGLSTVLRTSNSDAGHFGVRSMYNLYNLSHQSWSKHASFKVIVLTRGGGFSKF